MAFVPVANTVMVEIRYLHDLQQIENTLYFESAGAITAADIGTLLEALETWWTDNLQLVIPSAVTLVEFVGTDLTTATSPQVSRVPPFPIAGLVDDPALPNNVSLAVSFRTALRGRSFRGRNYHPALWETGVDANTVQPTIVAAIQAAYAALISDVGIGDAGFDWVVVSRFSGVTGAGVPIPRVAGVTTPVESVLIVDPVIDSMRRRLPGRGR